MGAMWRSGLFLADDESGVIVVMDSYEAKMFITLTGLKLDSRGASHISDVIQKFIAAIKTAFLVGDGSGDKSVFL